MSFDWSSVGAAPSAHEFEICVIGPGFGECIIIHLGQGRWMVVDSCIDPSDSSAAIPVAEKYLRAIGVQLDACVDLIVATHWHDDHVRGISRLLEACPSAEFSCAQALLKREFLTYVTTLGTGAAATNGAKVKEFSGVLRTLRSRNRAIRYAASAKDLRSWAGIGGVGSRPVVVKSLSPSDREYEIFLESIEQMLPVQNAPKRAAASQSPNLSSVVLHIEHCEFSVLLGADMEVHHDPGRGWNGVINNNILVPVQPSVVFKVPHHGSRNGHHDAVWTTMLSRAPICIVTPFNRLPEASKLPTDGDLLRLRQLGTVYVTAARNARRSGSRDPAVVRSLRESQIVTRDLSNSVGLVRMRRDIVGGNWRGEVFHPALELAPA